MTEKIGKKVFNIFGTYQENNKKIKKCSYSQPHPRYGYVSCTFCHVNFSANHKSDSLWCSRVPSNLIHTVQKCQYKDGHQNL